MTQVKHKKNKKSPLKVKASFVCNLTCSGMNLSELSERTGVSIRSLATCKAENRLPKNKAQRVLVAIQLGMEP